MPTIQFISLNCFGKQETNHTECDLTRPSGSFLALRLVCVPCLLSLSRAVIGEPLGGCARVVHTTITTVLPSGAPANYRPPSSGLAILIFFACPPLPPNMLCVPLAKGRTPLHHSAFQGAAAKGGPLAYLVVVRVACVACSARTPHRRLLTFSIVLLVELWLWLHPVLHTHHGSRCSIAAVTHTQPQPLPPPAPLSLTHTVACAQLKLDDIA